MDLGIRGRLALVTGASRGIGQAIAVELAREGARVILVARDEARLKAVQAGLAGAPDAHHRFAVDLMAEEAPLGLIRDITSRFGAPDIVVHNLGGSLGVRDAFAPTADWRKVWQFNVGIAVELNRAFLPEMTRKRWGRVVHVSTLSTTTFNGYAPYVAAKAALDAYVKTVGRETAKNNVVLSAVAPGAIYIEGRYLAKLQDEKSPEIEEYYRHHLPARRLGRVEEIAPAVAFLCSHQASFMTGSIVAIDGGGM